MKKGEVSDSDFLEEIFRLEDLVEYQRGSVVSRTIIDKDTGTVTVFALDQGEKISEHTVPFNALVYILEGAAEITISDNTIVLKAGESTMMPADAPHSLHAKEKYKMLLVLIR